nr:GntR family transcriptional regulator [Sphingomonas sp. CROZ-RG-20F-R02-07]
MVRLRELILRGTLKPGQRLLEIDLAERLQLSRTPIRQALPALALEGLLVRAGQRGYAVRSFTVAESLSALRLRAVLEGHAARSIVLEGRGVQMAVALQPLLDDGDTLLASGLPMEVIEEQYGRMNIRLHALVVERSADDLLHNLIARCNVVPFTGPGVIAFEHRAAGEVIDLLRYAHRQHHAIADAFRCGDATRVEMLFREHATTQEDSLRGGDLAAGAAPPPREPRIARSGKRSRRPAEPSAPSAAGQPTRATDVR